MTSLRRMGRLIAATATTALALGLAPVATAQDVVEFSVSNITDFHGRLAADSYNKEMGAALLTGLNDEINGEENIFTTSGDNVGGSAFVSSITNDQYTIDFLNAAGVDTSAVGNHEFDQGQDDLLNRILLESDFPILGANVYQEDGTRLLEPYSIEERNGVKIAFVGTVATSTASKVSPAGIVGLEFRDPVAETNQVARELKESGTADVVISLFHEDAAVYADGFDADYVDFLFGGDSHVTYTNADAPVPFAQSLEYGKLLTDVDFTFNKVTGEIESVTIEQYDYDRASGMGVVPDATVAGIVETAQAQADAVGEEIVAEIGHSFYRGSNDGAAPGSNRGVESTLNHLIAEAQRVSLTDLLGEPVDIGFMNAGGVRADLPAGNVSYADVYTVQPFGNEVSVATMSGQAILDTLEKQWKSGGERPRLALGLSDGFTYSYDPSAEQGNRIIGAHLNGEPIDPSADYRIAASTFLLEGGDELIDPADVRGILKVGYMDVQSLIDYLKANESVAPRADQADVAVTVNGDIAPGETVTLQLASLNYSNAGEPMAETVTVAIGDTIVTADIDNTFSAVPAGLGTHGTATVEITVPADYTGEGFVVSTDAGTRVLVPAKRATGPAESGLFGSSTFLPESVGSSF